MCLCVCVFLFTYVRNVYLEKTMLLNPQIHPEEILKFFDLKSLKTESKQD